MGNAQNLSHDVAPPGGEFKKFNEKEFSRLRKVFDALYDRFPYKTISQDTLLKTFPIPKDVARRLAKALDTTGAEIIDFQPFLDWLTLYCRGSMQLKMEILFRMWGNGSFIPVNRETLELLLSILMTPISRHINLSDPTNIPTNGNKETEYITSMLRVIFDDEEIEVDSDGNLRPQDYLDWQKENNHLVDMLEKILVQSRKKERSSSKKSPTPGEEQNDMEGFLFKVGRTFGNWHERWFALRGKFLYGYRTDRDKNYNDIIHLEGYEVERLNDGKAGFFGFKLTPPENSNERAGSSKALYAKSEEDRELWVKSLESASGVAVASGVGVVKKESQPDALEGVTPNQTERSKPRSGNLSGKKQGSNQQLRGSRQGSKQELRQSPKQDLPQDHSSAGEAPRTQSADQGSTRSLRPDSSGSQRHIASPRTNPLNRQLKKTIRYDAEAKYKIMQTVLMRINEHNERIMQLQKATSSLKDNQAEKIDDKNRKISKLESKVMQLEKQLEYKNQFIEDLRVKFQSTVQQNKAKHRKESKAMIEFHTTQHDEQIQKQQEQLQEQLAGWRDQAQEAHKEKATLLEDQTSTIETLKSANVRLIMSTSDELDRLRVVIYELEKQLEENRSWFW